MSWRDDPTLDPGRTSWVEVPEGSDFPIQNLPLGTIGHPDGHTSVAVRIGDHAMDLAGCQTAELLTGIPGLIPGSLAILQGVLFGPRELWRAIRERVSDLLTDPKHRRAAEPHLLSPGDVRPLLPVQARDYVDFYSSLEHATNLGRMFRPDQEPLLPNWRWMPIGYHGRAGTVVVSGTDVRRPRGQQAPEGDGPPSFGPTRSLDVELEMGFVTGHGNRLGEPIPVGEVRDHIFGLVLVNDWSARDVQRWEYQPLGPFLGKSFATTISPWVVSLDALEPYRAPGPPQDPPPLPHLATDEPWAYDVELEIGLQTPAMDGPATVSRTNMRYLYWSIAQQLAHATSNGATARPGDLFASGTISGPSPGSYGSLIELSWNGERPIALPDGSTRTFLEDGDTVVLRAWCDAEGKPRIGFGECRGTVTPAPGPGS